MFVYQNQEKGYDPKRLVPSLAKKLLDDEGFYKNVLESIVEGLCSLYLHSLSQQIGSGNLPYNTSLVFGNLDKAKASDLYSALNQKVGVYNVMDFNEFDKIKNSLESQGLYLLGDEEAAYLGYMISSNTKKRNKTIEKATKEVINNYLTTKKEELEEYKKGSNKQKRIISSLYKTFEKLKEKGGFLVIPFLTNANVKEDYYEGGFLIYDGKREPIFVKELPLIEVKEGNNVHYRVNPFNSSLYNLWSLHYEPSLNNTLNLLKNKEFLGKIIEPVITKLVELYTSSNQETNQGNKKEKNKEQEEYRPVPVYLGNLSEKIDKLSQKTKELKETMREFDELYKSHVKGPLKEAYLV
jgi:hypothetical protein